MAIAKRKKIIEIESPSDGSIAHVNIETGETTWYAARDPKPARTVEDTEHIESAKTNLGNGSTSEETTAVDSEDSWGLGDW